MNRRRTPPPAARAPALIVLAALPLVLTTSSVGVMHASATHTGESGPPSTAASVEATPAEDLTEQPDTSGLEAVPVAFRVPERPALGRPRAGDIPWGALQAYQRAAEILGEVQPSCGLSWTLLGAVGQVESEHGTVRGGELGDDGVVTPALLGRTLDGKGGRPAVEDTDGGEVDGADTWDRAVGPMQLLPGIWSLVGVDGDGDSTRSPQDLDDAALATAVYLCAAGTDLAGREGAVKALAEYNGSEGYAEQVLAVAKRYASRDFAVSGAPEPSTIGPTLGHGRGVPARESERALREAQEQREQPALTARPAEPAGPAGPAEPKDQEKVAAALDPAAASDHSEPAQRPTDEPGADSADEPAVEPTEQPAVATEDPAADPTGPSTEAPTEDPAEPYAEPTEQPTDQPTDQPTEAPTEDPAGEPADQPTEAPTEQPTAEPTERPTDEPTDEPTDQPTEEATEEPAENQATDDSEPTTTGLEGLLTVCGEDLCLDDTVLDLTLAGDLTADAGADLDGDGTIETVGDELAGLEGRTVELVGIEGSEPLLVVAVDGRVIVPE